MPAIRQPDWSIKADELLADGEWHDGVKFVREVEKQITPGVALRKILRRRKARLEKLGKEESERMRAIRETTLIAMGKRTLVQQLVNGRVTWETDPSPIPENGWSVGGWRIRNRRARQVTIAQVARDRYHVSPQRVRGLILADPALPHEIAGRMLYLDRDALPELDERVRTYKEASSQRYAAARRRTAERIRSEQTHTKFPITVLAKQIHVAPETATKVVKANPDFPWVRRGRITYVLVDDAPAFFSLCQRYLADRSARISIAGRAAKARAREAREERRLETPQFDSPSLTQLYSRYRNDEGELRSQVYEEMRQAFHAAPEV